MFSVICRGKYIFLLLAKIFFISLEPKPFLSDRYTAGTNRFNQLIQAGAEVAALLEVAPEIGRYGVHANKISGVRLNIVFFAKFLKGA